jgi:mannose-6-phosphate isomerase
VDVPGGVAHRIANTGAEEPLTFIEVQRGDYFGEDDIVRIEDANRSVDSLIDELAAQRTGIPSRD